MMIAPGRMPGPKVAFATAEIRNVTPLASGGYALATAAGVELLDATLAAVGRIAGPGCSNVIPLDDGTYLAIDSISRLLYEGRVGGKLAKISNACNAVVATTGGYHAAIDGRLLVVQAGKRRSVELPFRVLGSEHERRVQPPDGLAAWRGGSVVGGDTGLAIVEAGGAVLASSTTGMASGPIALAHGFAGTGWGNLVVFDTEARLIGQLPVEGGHALAAFGDGLLVHEVTSDFTRSEVSYRLVRDGAVEAAAWSWSVDADVKAMHVVGDHVVLLARTDTVWILDVSGREVAKLAIPDTVTQVAAFAGGVALCTALSGVRWWRPSAEAGSAATLVTLEHDGIASLCVGVPLGLATAEDKLLYLWRADVEHDGPERPSLAARFPVGASMVVGGKLVKIDRVGRFRVLGNEVVSRRMGWFDPDAVWRPAATRDHALQIVEQLVQRKLDGELPPLPAITALELRDHLAQLPLVQTAALHARALFAPTSLDAEDRARIAWAREPFFAELGAALGCSSRELLAAVRARKRTLVPPRKVEGYEYLGTFTTGGELYVTTGRTRSQKLLAHEGVWHVYLRPAPVASRAGELALIHETGFDVFATDPSGSIEIENGTSIGILDKQCPKPDADAPIEDGVFAGVGALAYAPQGSHPLFVGKQSGRVAKIRVPITSAAPEVDALVTTAAPSTARPYSVSSTFALGDAIQHLKLGVGTVIRVGTEGKIDVRFADATRTLVHAKK